MTPADVRYITYTLQPAVGSFCPDCHKPPELLAPASSTADAPWFYLCSCGFVGQGGVAPLRRGTKRT